jgi:perosamine synthetase
MKVDFYRHSLGEIEKQAIADVLDLVMLSTGNLTAEFERKFAQYLGVSHAIGVMSGTHALELQQIPIKPATSLIS